MSFLTSKIVLVVSLLLMYATNYLSSNTGILGESLTRLGEIFPFPYMPPGWVFGLSWGLIFLLSAVWCGCFLSQYRKPSETYRHIWRLVMMTVMLNISRLVATGQEYYFSAFVIIALLGYTLTRMLYVYRTQPRRGQVSRGIYTGWITVATVVLGISQVFYIVQGMVPESWTLTTWWGSTLLTMAVVVALLLYRKYRNPYTLIWSLGAIGVAAYQLFV